MRRLHRPIAVVIAALSLGAAGPLMAQSRGTKVVIGKASRVFVMSGFDAACQPMGPIVITVDKMPEKGTVTFREGEPSHVQYSLSGKCVGSKITGTGIYYTARPDAVGADTFAVTARIGRAEPASRAFTVVIADD